ncbi:hypothetical protein MWU52_04855 [Jannaschia sp. S6380]|uniref:hypothetical protein n=1 Tax=Jannaschia sp. S6380 TaxID=2926408 RepID=UPI001FF5F06A|nr:hypothetical protein [Jannaschia sp. S6380]MCK0166875.1 hypothetical protein [Jannaschia sp. S6380]
MRRLLLCTALSGLVPLSATAQERSLWDFVNPDRIVAQMVQYGLIAARTQVDLTYGDLSVSLLEGRAAIEGLGMVLPREMTGAAPCPIAFGTVEILVDDPMSIDRVAGRMSLRDVGIGAECIPPQAMPLRMMATDGQVRIPEIEVEYDYDVGSAGLLAAMRTRVEDMAALQLDVDFDYLWFRGEEPDFEPVGRLRAATLMVENLGAWEVLAPILPPPLTNPDEAAAFVTRMVGSALEQQADGPLPKPAKAFVTELAEGWAAFATDPKRLVIESGFAPDQPRPIDGDLVAAIEDSPLALIALLEPRVGTDAARERDLIDPGLVRRAWTDAAGLNMSERREVGLALLSGDRAPRNRALARDLLTPLAEAGDGEVALQLARALAETDPEGAYAQALAAGPTGAPGLRGLLDRLEADLPFATRLRLQSAAPEPGARDLGAPTSELRARAAAHLRGIGAPRSLRSALIYASVAAARGDRTAADLLERIDRAIPSDGMANWADVESEAAAIATEAWLARETR